MTPEGINFIAVYNSHLLSVPADQDTQSPSWLKREAFASCFKGYY